MRLFPKSGFLISSLFLVACADTALDKEEARVIKQQTIHMSSGLKKQSYFAHEMSVAYERAARSAATAQDVASFGVFLAAATAIGGAIGSASDTTIANRALAGAGTEVLAQRGVPKTAINSIYTGAKRLNCISTMSAVGVKLLSEREQPTIGAAQAVTFGAIREVMITTREGLVRDVADYGKIIEELSSAAGEDFAEALGPERKDFKVEAFNSYINLISNCLAEAPTIKDATVKNG
jgi:hypothetical protein